jgi:hypothetical protein
MKDTLPAHLAIVDPSWSSGHNVVVDGYNTDNYYHLNFGWGGSYNGWYLIPQQIPYSLTVIEGVVLDIIKSPATRIPVSEKEYKSVQIFPNPSVNGYFKVKYTSEDFENVCMKIFTIEGTEIYNNTIPKKSGTIEIPVNSEKLRSGYYIIELKSGNNIYRNKLIVQ